MTQETRVQEREQRRNKLVNKVFLTELMLELHYSNRNALWVHKKCMLCLSQNVECYADNSN